MPAIAFPFSSTPGRFPGEGEGRVINASVSKEGDTVYWRRVPGLVLYAAITGQSGPRGLIDVAGTIYAAFSGSVVKVAPNGGSFTVISGSLLGTAGVTFARNNRVTGGLSTPDLVAVREDGGAYLIDIAAGSIAPYADTALPATVNSVAFLGGFFLFSIPDGRMYASGVNNIWVQDADHSQNALSYATAESSADRLVRGVVANGRYHAMGSETIEIWMNYGNSPFPLARATSVISVGLLTTMAVAGFEEGWDRSPFFVAHDCTVRELTGYRTSIVSTADVEDFIGRSTVASLEACVYTSRGKAIWALSSNLGTWELDVGSGAWRERVSTGASRWRGSRSVKSNGRWVVGDTLSGNLLAVSDTVRTEAGEPVVWTLESSPSKAYPARIGIPAVFMDFGPVAANVSISWSMDGGVLWSGPVVKSMTSAEYPVELNTLGQATHHGLRLRLSVSDDVGISFTGASVPEPEVRAP